MIRRIVVSRHGGPEVLLPITEEPPEPGPGEARLAVEAAGVNRGSIACDQQAGRVKHVQIARGVVVFDRPSDG